MYNWLEACDFVKYTAALGQVWIKYMYGLPSVNFMVNLWSNIPMYFDEETHSVIYKTDIGFVWFGVNNVSGLSMWQPSSTTGLTGPCHTDHAIIFL